MKPFGTKEYGNQHGFRVICNECHKEAWIVPVTYYSSEDVLNPEKIKLELRCSCGNRYGATIYDKT